MALTESGGWWHATSAADLDEYLLTHVLGRLKRGKQHHVVHARCGACGKEEFDLFIDDGGRAMRTCTSCQADHAVCDLDEKFDLASAGEIVCSCMYSACEVAVGFALSPPRARKAGQEGTTPLVRYLYVAGRCVECGLCGIYAEWSVTGSFPAKIGFDCA